MRLVKINETTWINPAHVEAVGIQGVDLKNHREPVVYVNMASDVGYSVEALEGETVEQTLARVVETLQDA